MKPYFYTFNRQHGIPTVKHDSLEIAQGEAERLAAKLPGQAFEILRCVGIAQTSKASTFWVDGEEPPEKPRYRDLEDGEIIEKSEEFKHPDGWRKHHASYGSIGQTFRENCFLPHRRPL